MCKVGIVSNGWFVAFLCCITATPLSDHWKVVVEFYIKWFENGYSGSMLLRCATALSSTERLKYSNCNQGIHFHHHCQACLIRYFGREQMPLLMHMIQCRIWVWPGYFMNWVRPAWPGQTWPGWPGWPDPVSTLSSIGSQIFCIIKLCSFLLKR